MFIYSFCRISWYEPVEKESDPSNAALVEAITAYYHAEDRDNPEVKNKFYTALGHANAQT